MNLSIQRINKNDAVEFVRNYHYSKIMPRLTKEYLGIYKGTSDELQGVVN